MIILDTHIWIWHVQADGRLDQRTRRFLEQNETTGIGVSAISIWEVAKAVQLGRLTLPVSTEQWLNQASAYPGVKIISLSPEVCVESTNLPGTFHKDPADQLIVATARVQDDVLVTADSKILAYPNVKVF